MKLGAWLAAALFLGCGASSGGAGGGAGGSGAGAGGSGGGKGGGGGSFSGVTTRASLPSKRAGLASAEVKGIVYAFGGADNLANPLNPHLSRVDAYDPVADTWSMKPALPSARSGHVAVAVNNLIYVIGGDNAVAPNATANVFKPLNTVESYDPNTNNWAAKAAMPTARERFAAAAVGTVIYVFGGLVPDATFVKSTASVEAYDTSTNSWSAKAPLSSPRNALAAVALGGKIYVLGGRADGTPSNLALVEVYDPVVNTWSSKSPLSIITGGLSAALVNGKLYAVNWDYGYTTVEAYDPVTDVWTGKSALQMRFTSREWFAMTPVGGVAYTLGGFDAAGPLVTVETITP